MARSIEIALALLEKSIERGKTDSDYYMDFVKLHKLLYLGQCLHRFKWNMNLFEEEIIASDSGPYVRGLDFVLAICGFDKIKNVDVLRERVYFFPITFLRDETCEFILDNFGKCSTNEIVLMTKETMAYQKHYSCCNSVISKSSMKKTGEDLFSERDKEKAKVKV